MTSLANATTSPHSLTLKYTAMKFTITLEVLDDLDNLFDHFGSPATLECDIWNWLCTGLSPDHPEDWTEHISDESFLLCTLLIQHLYISREIIIELSREYGVTRVIEELFNDFKTIME